jgi:glutamine amidotransferase
MQRVALIDYGSGNLHSANKALIRAAQGASRDASIVVTGDPTAIAQADRIVLPGVGAFAACRDRLLAMPGLLEALEMAVRRRGVPFLGICVGMQLMATRGFEHGESAGLGWIAGEVRPLDAAGQRIPHIGWNDVEGHHPILPPAGDAYFVHSYAFVPEAPNHQVATCEYGRPFAAAIGRDNLVGVQFHPEKSQGYGLGVLTRFLDWTPV